jgi:hypothetical protein
MQCAQGAGGDLASKRRQAVPITKWAIGMCAEVGVRAAAPFGSTDPMFRRPDGCAASSSSWPAKESQARDPSSSLTRRPMAAAGAMNG